MDSQQDRAMKCAGELIEKASLYRQMGFHQISAYCIEQAKFAERWALKIIKDARFGKEVMP